jgi:hypothetical protein
MEKPLEGVRNVSELVDDGVVEQKRISEHVETLFAVSSPILFPVISPVDGIVDLSGKVHEPLFLQQNSLTPVIEIPLDDELPNLEDLLSPNVGRKEVLVSGHGAKVKVNDQTPKILDQKHGYSETSWQLADRVLVLVCFSRTFFLHLLLMIV